MIESTVQLSYGDVVESCLGFELYCYHGQLRSHTISRDGEVIIIIHEGV